MSEIELTLWHSKEQWTVTADAEFVYVDDSFDHAFGTEECGQWEVDWDMTEIIEVCNANGEEVDYESIPGLTWAIHQAIDAYNYEP